MNGRWKLRSSWARYGAAVLLVGIATLARLALNPMLGLNVPYAIFYVSMAMAAAWCGTGPAILTSLLGFIVVEHLFIWPVGLLRGDLHDPVYLVRTVSYLLASSVIIAITRRLRAREEAVIESEDTLRVVYNSGYDAILLHWPDGKVFDANDVFLRMYGVQRQDLSGVTVQSISSPSMSQERVQTLWKRVLAGEPQLFEWRAKRHDNDSEFDVEVFLRHVQIRRRDAIIASVRDITQRKQRDARLAEQARLLDLSNDAIVVCDANDRIIYWNKGAEQMYGHAADQVLGKTMDELVQTIYPTSRTAAFEALQKAGRWSGELVHTRRDGRRITTDSRWVLDRDAEGRLRAILQTNNDISARKSAEQAVAEREAQLRLFIEHAPAALAMFDHEMRYVAASNRWKQDFKIEGEVGGRLHYEVLPDIPEHWKRLHQRGLAGELLKEEEEAFHRADGTTQWLRWEIHPWHRPDGRIGGILIATEDVTAKVEAKKALRESEERFRTLAENIPQLAWTTLPDGSITWYNQRWYDYTGTTLQQTKGWGWQRVQHPDHVDRVTARFKRAMEMGQPWEDTFPLRRKDGQYRWFLSRAFPIRDASGKITRWFGTNTDVTELRETQAALAEREALLRMVTHEARVGLVMVDENRRYLFANRTYADILGLPDAGVVGRRVEDVLPHLYYQISSKLERAFAGERVCYELHKPATTQDGQERFYEVTYEPRTAPGSKYVIVVLVDVTERKRAQQILERTVAERTAELRDSIGQLETFSYSVSHDLRGPLRAMNSFATLLRDEYGERLDDVGRDYLQRIRDAASRMDQLIQDVLAYSKMAKDTLLLEQVDVGKLLDDTLNEYPNLAEQRHLISVDTACCSAMVMANRAALTQVMYNLIINALKFVPRDRTPQVRIGCEDRGDYVRLVVADNGVGIPLEQRTRIFGMFQRLHGSSVPGTGIGLSIVKKAVERMEGRLGLESEVGKGSTFWVELPKAHG